MCSFYDSASFRRGLYPDEWSTPLTASSSSTHPAHFTERARVQSGQQSAMVGSTDAYQRELDAESRLALIQRRARRDVCKIKALFILLSLVCVALTWPANLASMDPSLPREWVWLLSFQPLGIFFLVLAVHPQDRIMVRIFFFTFMMVGFLCGPIICIPQGIGKIWTVECANTTISPQNFLHGPSVSSPDIYCITYINLFLVQFVGCLLMGCGSLKAVQCTNGCKEWKMTAYAAYRRVFFVGRAASVIWGTGFVVGGIILAPTGPEELRVYHLALIVFGTELILFAAIMTPRFIQRLHGWVAKVATRGEAREAAGVAALMGKYGPAKTLRIAKEHFRGIDFADLSEIDFTDNGDSGLHVKTQKSRLGSLDAFMSHSWRDPGKPKFAALSKWAKAFQGRTGRHPTLWLDKACIDQDNIEESLAVLPVFLSGCRELLVVAGPSYTHRLWCVMEIYTFLRMGGTVERIHVLPAEEAASATDLEAPPLKVSAPEGSASQDAALRTVLRRFEEFHVEEAECTVVRDKEHLLGVIEQGFGSFDNFNELVRRTFVERFAAGTNQMAESSQLSLVSPPRVKPYPKTHGERRVTREPVDSDDDDEEALTDEQKKRMDENRMKALGSSAAAP